MSAVVRLAAMRGAAIAVEAVRIGIGVEAERFDLADAGRRQPGDNEGFEIEMGPARRSLAEVALVSGIQGQQPLLEAMVDFVIAAGNGRAEAAPADGSGTAAMPTRT